MALNGMKRQVERIITSHGGVIFGGYVRDLVLNDDHDTAAPSDIDCYMVFHAIRPFMESLIDVHITVDTVFERDDVASYFNVDMDIPRGILKHIRLRLKVIADDTATYVHQLLSEGLNENARAVLRKTIHTFVASIRRAALSCEPLMLDVFTADCHNFFNIYPPFGSVDFECNGLILTRSGISLSPHMFPDLTHVQRQDKLQSIFADIKNRKAVYISGDVPLHRIVKMRAKRWIVPMKHTQVVDHSPIDADVCIVCHEDVCSKHYKLPCCNAIYHRDCLIQVVSSEYAGQCIMCKRKSNAHDDVALIKSES